MKKKLQQEKYGKKERHLKALPFGQLFMLNMHACMHNNNIIKQTSNTNNTSQSATATLKIQHHQQQQ